MAVISDGLNIATDTLMSPENATKGPGSPASRAATTPTYNSPPVLDEAT